MTLLFVTLNICKLNESKRGIGSSTLQCKRLFFFGARFLYSSSPNLFSSAGWRFTIENGAYHACHAFSHALLYWRLSEIWFVVNKFCFWICTTTHIGMPSFFDLVFPDCNLRQSSDEFSYIYVQNQNCDFANCWLISLFILLTETNFFLIFWRWPKKFFDVKNGWDFVHAPKACI